MKYIRANTAAEMAMSRGLILKPSFYSGSALGSSVRYYLACAIYILVLAVMANILWPTIP